MSVQLSAPEQKSEEKTEEVAMHRGQQGTSGSRGREGAADVKVEGAANVKVVGQGGAGGGEAGKCGALAGLEGVVVLRGKDGCIGMTPHQIRLCTSPPRRVAALGGPGYDHMTIEYISPNTRKIGPNTRLET